MITFLLVTGVIIAIIIFLVVRLVRRNKNPRGFRLADVGTIIDRSLRAYRRHLLLLLALATLCTPLGMVTGTNPLLSAGLLFEDLDQPSTRWLIWLVYNLIAQFAVGKTLLACGVARVMQLEESKEPVSLGTILSHGRWGAMIGLAILLALPTFISSFLGLIGALLGLLWALASTVLVYESLGPWAAFKRSAGIVWGQFGGILNTLVPLGLIGWLIVGTPLIGGLMLAQLLIEISPDTMSALILVIGLVGNIFVAPLLAMGSFQFYIFVRDRDAALREEHSRLEALVAQVAHPPAANDTMV